MQIYVGSQSSAVIYISKLYQVLLGYIPGSLGHTLTFIIEEYFETITLSENRFLKCYSRCHIDLKYKDSFEPQL